jgi:trimeric autotransporter adhesin
MSYKRISPQPVVEGGTGVQSNTAYTVLCGGTTTTNPIQSIASVGTAGQILTSNGAAALPTFQDIPGGVVVETITGNSGGAVSPLLGNINIIGDVTGINIVGNAGTHTLTASLGGQAAQSFDTDSGSATPNTGIIIIEADTAGNHSGSSVSFSGSSNIVLLNVTDSNNNTIIGESAGNQTLTGTSNTVIGSAGASGLTSGSNNTVVGASGAAENITSGSRNVCIGTGSGNALITGANNVLIGYASGSNYDTSEGSNICIGSINTGTTGESNVLRIGIGTGTSSGQLNKSFISGIRGITPAGGNGIPVYIDSSGQLGTVGTGIIQTLTANSGGAVSPALGNINIVGDGVGINIVGNPGTNTLTASLVGGGGGGAVESFTTDDGMANPTGGVINILAQATSGSTVFFSGSTDTIEFNVTDTSLNTIIGQGAGNLIITGDTNTVLGAFAAQGLSSGAKNVMVGVQAASSLDTGSNNVFLGYRTGQSYTTSESNNICIGYNNTGTVGESNVLRIGIGTGTSSGQLNKSFISGIRGITPAGGDGIPVYIDSSGQLGTVGTGALVSITGNTGGAQTGPAITLTGGATGASFGGAANTITMTFAGITANGGTVSLATDATTSTINVGTGAGVKTVTMGSTNGASVSTIRSGSGGITIAASNGTMNITAGSGTLSIANDGSSNTVNVGTGVAIKTVNVGSTTSTSSTTIQSGSGAINLNTNGGAVGVSTLGGNFIVATNVGSIQISADNVATGISLGTGAGVKNITIGSTTSNSTLALKTGTGNFSLASATGTTIAASSAGRITMPLQPAFLAYISTTVPNTTGDGTFYTVAFNTEVYDQNSNFSSTTFTAPVTGTYHFSCGLYVGLLSVAFTNGNILIITSNGTYLVAQGNFGAMQSGTTIAAGNNVYADMDAADTTIVDIQVSGSTKTIEVAGSDISGERSSFFSGVLVV